MTPITTEKFRLIQKLTQLHVLPTETTTESETATTPETRYPFFDKNHLPLIDYLTAHDLMELAGYNDQPTLFALLIIMFHQLSEGSLCLNLQQDNLVNRLKIFTDTDTAQKLAESILSALNKEDWKRLVSKNQDNYRPLILTTLPDRNLLYFQKYKVHEKRLGERIKKFLSAPCPAAPTGAANVCPPETAIEKIIEKLYTPTLVLRITDTNNPIAMDPFQVQAIRLAASSGFAIISGGPGTGKTSLMVNILRCLVRIGHAPDQILLCAPTGRAAQRMTEAISKNIDTIQNPTPEDESLRPLKGATLHKALRFSARFNRFFFNAENPLPASVVVVDEVSMVDVVMMEKFLSAVDYTKTRVILLGDKDQLPSVEAGAVLADMIPEGARADIFKDHLVVLENVYRSGHRLQKLAKEINAGQAPITTTMSLSDAMNMPPGQWAMVTPDTLENWRLDLNLWAEHHYLSPLPQSNQEKESKNPKPPETNSYASRIASAMKLPADTLANSEKGKALLQQILGHTEKARILTLVRNGPFGNTVINQQICAHLSHRLKTSDWQKRGMFSGQIIIITRNDYARELFNGDIGVIIKDAHNIFRAWFNRPEGPQAFSPDLLPGWESAFALTVHKSQGSEFDNVLIALPPDETHRLLTREILYTAITRAKKRVIIHAKPSVLTAALSRKIQRESGLIW